MFEPFAHAAAATGSVQTPLLDVWSSVGVCVALSDVTGPHLYRFGAVPVPVVAITLYEVQRHVLMVDGQVRRDARVLPGRFRIGQPGREIVVDACPGETASKRPRKWLLIYLGSQLTTIAANEGRRCLELRDEPYQIDDPFLHLTARQMVKSAGRDAAIDRLLADQLGLTLGLYIFNRYCVSSQRPASGGMLARGSALRGPALERVMDYVRNNIGVDCSLAKLASLADLSPSHFLRQFRAATGITPHQFVIVERVNAAKHRLSQGSKETCEIAFDCGFASQSHFGMAFKRVTGMTPNAYRKAIRDA